jgi:carboxypeptidase Taq
MNQKLIDLKNRLHEIYDLECAAQVLVWDQATYMPVGGGPARGRQIALIERIAHEKFIDPEIGRLLDVLRPLEESLPYDSDEASLIRETRRQYERRIKVPPAFVAEFCEHIAQTYDAWVEAKPADDFARLLPLLEKTIDLSRRYSSFFPGSEHIADPLIDRYDRGMKTASLRKLFAELRSQLVPLVKAITSQPPIDAACVFQHFPKDKQLAFAEGVVRRLGYDFERGRIDLTHHPFMIRFSLGDIRITTRVNENDVRDALFSNIHESGHAMYEQGIAREYEGSPLAEGTSAGVHESQSRLWENLVGRSHDFWEFFYPQIQAAFPDQLNRTPLETFYRAVNKVERTLIRTDADEVTYNLHVMLRLDFELQMLEGSLHPRDLPEAWHERLETDLGLTPKNDAEGVMQDVHWFSDHVGGVFQGYTLGNIMSAQFYAAALKAIPDIPEQIRRGEFAPLRGWLTENVYRHGAKFTADELLQRATGMPLTIEPYMRYLKTKYGELYGLTFD